MHARPGRHNEARATEMIFNIDLKAILIAFALSYGAWASPSFPDALPSPLNVAAPRIEPG